MNEGPGSASHRALVATIQSLPEPWVVSPEPS